MASPRPVDWLLLPSRYNRTNSFSGWINAISPLFESTSVLLLVIISIRPSFLVYLMAFEIRLFTKMSARNGSIKTDNCSSEIDFNNIEHLACTEVYTQYSYVSIQTFKELKLDLWLFFTGFWSSVKLDHCKKRLVIINKSVPEFLEWIILLYDWFLISILGSSIQSSRL